MTSRKASGGLVWGALVGMASHALAVNEAGPEGVGADTINVPGGAYATGITYTGSDGLTLQLNDPSLIVTNTGVSVSGNNFTNVMAVQGLNFNSISTSLASRHGIFVSNANPGGSQASLTAGSITTAGSDARGLYAFANSPINSSPSGDLIAQVVVDGGTIETFGLNAHGALAETNPGSRGYVMALMTGGSITTHGANSDGLSANSAGFGPFPNTGAAHVTLTGGVIHTIGSDSRGISSISLPGGLTSIIGPNVRLLSGMIVTEGARSYGLFSNSNGYRINIDIASGSITTSGADAHGAYALRTLTGDFSNINMSGGTITTTGLGAAGLVIVTNTPASPSFPVGSGAYSGVSMTGGSISTSNDNADGIRLTNNSPYFGSAGTTLIAGSIQTTGNNSHGIATHATTLNSQVTPVISIRGGTVQTSGVGSNGAYITSASSPGGGGPGIPASASFSMSSGSITTSGADSRGAYLTMTGLSDPIATITGGSIVTTGTNSDGVIAQINNLLSTATAQITMSNGLVSTANTDSYGLTAITTGRNSSIINLSGGTVQTTGANSDGVNAELTNVFAIGTAQITMSSGLVSTAGADSDGLRAINGGRFTSSANIILSGGTVQTTGDRSMGVRAEATRIGPLNILISPTAVVTMSNATISTAGQDSAGVYTSTSARGLSSISLTNGSITTTGANSRGAYAYTAGIATASLVMDGTTITTTGDGMRAEINYADSTVLTSLQMTNGSISTNYANANGMIATTNGLGDVTVLSNSTNGITTAGDDSIGAFAWINNASSLANVSTTLTSGSIQTSGARSHGASAQTSGFGTATLTVSGVQVSASGLDSNGGVASSDLGNSVVSINSAVMGGSSLGSGLSTGSVASGTTTIYLLAGSVIGAWSDNAVTAVGGATTLTNNGTIYGMVQMTNSGDLFVNNSSNSWDIRNFEDTNADMIRDREAVAISDFGAGVDTFTNTATGVVRLLTVQDLSGFTVSTDDDTAPTTWDTTGQYFAPGSASVSMTSSGVEQAHLVNLEFFENAGIITMADAETGGLGPVAGDVFAITGNSVVNGTSGGGVYLSNGGQVHIDTVLNDGVIDITDVFVIDRAVIGTGSTVLLVNNAQTGLGATTDINRDNLFSVGEGILVVQALEAGSDSTAFVLGNLVEDGAYAYVLDQTDGQSWYLHTLLGGGGGAYETSPYAHMDSFLGHLPTLEQRVGQRTWDNTNAQQTTAARNDSKGGLVEESVVAAEPLYRDGGWVRIHSDHINANLSSGTSYQTQDWGIQAGNDYAMKRGDDGQWVLGVTGQMGEFSTSVEAAGGTGTIESEGAGVGATATWYGDNGFYTDIQGQMNWMQADYGSTANGTLASNELMSLLSGSVEAGRRYAVNEHNGLIPQAQLMWICADSNSFTDNSGTLVDLERNERLIGRLGLAYDYLCREWHDDAQHKLYGIVNLLHEFKNDSQVTVGGTPLASDREATWLEVGAGGTLTMRNSKQDRITQLYAEISYRQAIESSQSDGFATTLGFRFYW